jgi:integrase
MVRRPPAGQTVAAGIGTIVNHIEKAAVETKEVEAWPLTEVETLLRVAVEHEPRFGPFLKLLLSTGMRRGEALGLKWTGIDLASNCEPRMAGPQYEVPFDRTQSSLIHCGGTSDRFVPMKKRGVGIVSTRRAKNTRKFLNMAKCRQSIFVRDG